MNYLGGFFLVRFPAGFPNMSHDDPQSCHRQWASWDVAGS